MASAHSHPTTQALLEQVEQGATGRLSVGAGSAELAVFLLDGVLVGTQANDDTAALVTRLGGSGTLPTARARQLQAMVQMSLPILGRQTYDPILGLLSDEIGVEVGLARRRRGEVERVVVGGRVGGSGVDFGGHERDGTGDVADVRRPIGRKSGPSRG